MTSQEETRVPTKHHRMGNFALNNRGLTWFLIGLALLTVAQTLLVNTQKAREANCQAQYNLAFTRALDARTSLADTDRRNLITFIKSVRDAKAPQDFDKAINKYIAEFNRVDSERQAHPLPTIPEGGCG